MLTDTEFKEEVPGPSGSNTSLARGVSGYLVDGEVVAVAAVIR